MAVMGNTWHRSPTREGAGEAPMVFKRWLLANMAIFGIYC